MPVDLGHIENIYTLMSRKKCPSASQCVVQWDNTWGSLGHNWDIHFSALNRVTNDSSISLLTYKDMYKTLESFIINTKWILPY